MAASPLSKGHHRRNTSQRDHASLKGTASRVIVVVLVIVAEPNHQFECFQHMFVCAYSEDMVELMSALELSSSSLEEELSLAEASDEVAELSPEAEELSSELDEELDSSSSSSPTTQLSLRLRMRCRSPTRAAGGRAAAATAAVSVKAILAHPTDFSVCVGSVMKTNTHVVALSDPDGARVVGVAIGISDTERDVCAGLTTKAKSHSEPRSQQQRPRMAWQQGSKNTAIPTHMLGVQVKLVPSCSPKSCRVPEV